MSFAETLVWMVVGASVGTMWRAGNAPSGPWRQALVGAFAALLGGAAARPFDPSGRAPGAFGIWSLLMAVVFAVAALMVWSSVVERRRARGSR
jgi:hypothetical protein